uniref:C-type lectin domain-containing protein n=1 Tax=Cyprinus carpio TaxID=7962 RepID=A0A8C2A1W3_CYPCA
MFYVYNTRCLSLYKNMLFKNPHHLFINQGRLHITVDLRLSRCLVLITVGLGLICVLLLVFIILLHISITAERDLIKSYKNTAEEFNQTINSLQDNYTDLMTEKHQLQNNFSSLSQKNLELETRVKDLTAEKNQLQRNVEPLNKKKLELETELRNLSGQGLYESIYTYSCTLMSTIIFVCCICLLKGNGRLFISTELKSWSDSRQQYCRDRGADLVIINTEEKQVSLCECLLMNEMWIGLSDREQEDNACLKMCFALDGAAHGCFSAWLSSVCTVFVHFSCFFFLFNKHDQFHQGRTAEHSAEHTTRSFTGFQLFRCFTERCCRGSSGADQTLQDAQTGKACWIACQTQEAHFSNTVA